MPGGAPLVPVQPEYASAESFARVIAELCAGPGSLVSVDEICQAGEDGGEAGACSQVKQTPRRFRGNQEGRYIFGKDRDAYVMVRPRRDDDSWPVTRDGRYRPVRLHRWVANVPAGMVTRHACDNSSCLARAHLTAGTSSENAFDRRRLRRRSRFADRADFRQRTLDADPAVPELSSCHAVSMADRLFCVAGYHSPSKKARLAMRESGRLG